MVAYLEKLEGSEGFHQIIDFLSASHIKYALTNNPTIYASLIEQFLQTAALSTIEDGVMAITAAININVKVLITEASIRRHLKLGDSEGLSTLPTKEIFQQLAFMGYARRLIEELDMDADISLVPPHAADQGRKLEDTQVSGQPEDQLGVFCVAKVLGDAAEQGRSVGNAMDKGKAFMQESKPTKKIKKRIQVQMSIDEELDQKLHEKELARFNAEQEAIDIARKDKVVVEGDQAHDIDWSDPTVISYHTLQNRPGSVAEVRKSISSEIKKNSSRSERQSTEEEKGKKSDDNSKPTRKKTLARKRACGNDSQESMKKQKLEDDTEKKELKAYLDIVQEDEFVMEVEPLATKQDVMDLHKLVEERYTTTSPKGYDLMLWGDLKTLFKPDEENEL
nr:hypothetical protein [Tanacetum cinerariifolium]